MPLALLTACPSNPLFLHFFLNKTKISNPLPPLTNIYLPTKFPLSVLLFREARIVSKMVKAILVWG